MSKETLIEWTHRRHPKTGIVHPGGTANYWIGCTPCDAACTLCYAWAQDAARFSKTLGGATAQNPIPHFGKGCPRVKVKGVHDTMRALDRAAARAGIPLAAFTNSLADFFDEEVEDAWRDEAFDTIFECRNVDTMLLTKRADKMNDYLTRSAWWLNATPENVWLGVTAANKAGVQKRVGVLRGTPAAVRFLSCEPLLEDIAGELQPHLASGEIHLVIVGGESEDTRHPNVAKGHHARPMHPDWVRGIQELCWLYDVPFFFKQWGEFAPAYELDHNPQAQAMCIGGKVPKHDFGFGQGGRRFAYKVGKVIAGHYLDGRIQHAQPKWRQLPAPSAVFALKP